MNERLAFYVGEVEAALVRVEQQLTLSGQAEVPRVRALAKATRNLVKAFDEETTPTEGDNE